MVDQGACHVIDRKDDAVVDVDLRDSRILHRQHKRLLIPAVLLCRLETDAVVQLLRTDTLSVNIEARDRHPVSRKAVQTL